MNVKKIVLGLLLVCLSSISYINSQERKTINAELSGDLVSSYVWRGFRQAGASVQPALSVEWNGFSLSSWASIDISGDDSKEVDFAVGYSVSGLSISLTDYWWDGEGAYRYFSSPKDGKMGHMLEAGLSYTLPASFPLSLSWNTFFLGKGNKKANGDNSFSTYIEASYPFAIKNIDFSISTGFIPWESAVYGSEMDGFKFTSIRLGACKEIKINDKFNLPVFANIIANPALEDMHFVFGFTIK